MTTGALSDLVVVDFVESDRPWADWVVATLAAFGVRGRMRCRDDAYARFEAPDCSAIELVVLSPAYFSQGTAQWPLAWAEAWLQDRLVQAAVLSILVDGELGPGFPAAAAIADLRRPIERHDEAAARTELLQRLRERHPGLLRSGLDNRGIRPGPGQPDRLPWRLPARPSASNLAGTRNLHAIAPLAGLRSGLGKISAAFERGQSVHVLRGPESAGKKTLAAQYARSARDRYDIMWHVSGDSPGLVPLQLGPLGSYLEIPLFLDRAETLHQIRVALGRDVRTLVVVDHTRHLEQLSRLFPHRSVDLLLLSTGRPVRSGTRAAVTNLPAPSYQDGVDLIESHLGEGAAPPSEVARLVEVLAREPHAIDLAGRCIRRSGMSTSGYLRLVTRGLETRCRRRGSRRLAVLGAAYDIAIAFAHDASPDAVGLAELLAWMTHHPTPVSGLVRAIEHAGGPLVDTLGPLDRMERATGVLAELGIARVNDGKVQLTSAARRFARYPNDGHQTSPVTAETTAARRRAGTVGFRLLQIVTSGGMLTLERTHSREADVLAFLQGLGTARDALVHNLPPMPSAGAIFARGDEYPISRGEAGDVVGTAAGILLDHDAFSDAADLSGLALRLARSTSPPQAIRICEEKMRIAVAFRGMDRPHEALQVLAAAKSDYDQEASGDALLRQLYPNKRVNLPYLFQTALCLRDMGVHAESLPWLYEGLEQLVVHGQLKSAEAIGLRSIAIGGCDGIWTPVNQADLADENLTTARELYGDDSPATVSHARSELGLALAKEGCFAAGFRHLDAVVEMAAQSAGPAIPSLTAPLIARAMSHLLAGEQEHGLHDAKRATELVEIYFATSSTDTARSICRGAYTALGDALFARGEPEASRAAYHRALAFAGDRHRLELLGREVRLLSEHAPATTATRRLSWSWDFLRQAYAFGRTVPVTALQDILVADILLNDLPTAVAKLERATDVLTNTRVPSVEAATALAGAGRALVLSGHPGRAAGFYRRAIGMFDEEGRGKARLALALVELGGLLTGQHENPAQAVELLTRAQGILAEHGNRLVNRVGHLTLRCQHVLGKAQRLAGDTGDSLRTLSQALHTCQEDRTERLIYLDLLTELGHSLYRVGRLPEAADVIDEAISATITVAGRDQPRLTRLILLRGLARQPG